MSHAYVMDPVGFVKQAFNLEKFLVDDMDAIRAWFFVIMVAWSMLFALEKGREILRWIMKLAQAFPKEVRVSCTTVSSAASRSCSDPSAIP